MLVLSTAQKVFEGFPKHAPELYLNALAVIWLLGPTGGAMIIASRLTVSASRSSKEELIASKFPFGSVSSWVAQEVFLLSPSLHSVLRRIKVTSWAALRPKALLLGAFC